MKGKEARIAEKVLRNLPGNDVSECECIVHQAFREMDIKLSDVRLLAEYVLKATTEGKRKAR